jgi:hypothetical protein
LGPLADDDLETARLRETLEVFLTTGSNYMMAADKLHVRPNTIKYRIHKAQDRLLVTTNDGRIDVARARSVWSTWRRCAHQRRHLISGWLFAGTPAGDSHWCEVHRHADSSISSSR